MKTFLSILLTFTLLSSLSGQETQVVRGQVTDAQSGAPLLGVNIALVDSKTQVGTVTDEEGRFALSVPIGTRALVFSYLGYQKLQIEQLLVRIGKEVLLNVALEEQVYETVAAQVVAQGGATTALQDLGSRNLSTTQLERFPGSRNDIARMLASYPGVFVANDQRNDLIIRGNSPLGVQWRLEGVPVANPNHFATLGTTGGPVSILNPNVLSDARFLMGNMAAEYGNAYAGVVDLGFRPGNKEHYEFTAQLGAFSGLELMAEGPLSRAKEHSFLLAYRHSFLELIDVFNVDLGIGSIPNYKDLSFKLDFDRQKWGKLAVFGMGGQSNIQFSSSRAGSQLGVLGIDHRLLLDDRSYLKTTLALNVSKSQFEDYTVRDGQTLNDYEENDKTTAINLVSYWHRKISARQDIRIGGSMLAQHLDTNAGELLQNTGWTPLRDAAETFLLWQFFAQSNYQFSPRWSFQAGIHSQYWGLSNDVAVEPRLALNWQPHAQHKLSLGYSLIHQAQPLPVYFHFEGQASGAYSTNRNLGFTQSHNWGLEYRGNLGRDWHLRSNWYLQQLENVPVELNPSAFSSLNIGASFGFPVTDSLVNAGQGVNYGWEIGLEKSFKHNYYLMANVALMKGRYQGSDQQWRRTAFSQDYVVNLLAGKNFKLSALSQNSFSIDVKLTHAAGRYFTPYDLEASITANKGVLDETRAFSQQLPAYLRADMRMGFQLNSLRRKWSHQFYLELQNMSNHQNPLRIYYDKKRQAIRTQYQVGFFFDLLYRLQF